MTDILSHDPASTACARATSLVSEVVEYHLNGGIAPQININLTEPLVGGAHYTFSGNITAISDGGQVIGLCMGGGPGVAHTEVGSFQDDILTEPGADGQTVFCIRGLTSGTVATITDVSLVPVVG